MKGGNYNHMKYCDGQDVLLGDRVIADNSDGVVVCVIDDNQFSEKYPEGWGYLKTGMLIETKAMGLVHYPQVDEDIILIERASSKIT